MPLTENRTLAERAFSEIHESIVSGRYGPGYHLRIEELAETLQISPTPIREALHRLESLGLAEKIPHRGSRVSDLNPTDLIDVYEARLALEPMAVARAAARFSAKDEQIAREYLDRLNSAERRSDYLEAWKAHTGFHFSMYHPSQSAWLIRLITPLWERCQCYRLKWHPLRADLKRRAGEHLSMLEACIEHDASRAQLEMYNHLATTANSIYSDMVGKTFFDLKIPTLQFERNGTSKHRAK